MTRFLISRRHLLGLLPIALALRAGRAVAVETALVGTVAYRERMALPPGAILVVKLVDVSRADTPAETIAETSVPAGPGSPIRYTLRFDHARIVDQRSYALQARISDGDRLLFITTAQHRFVGDGMDSTDITVTRVAAPADSLEGRWLAEDIRGGGVIDRLQTVLQIGGAGAVSGNGGCNSFSGRAAIDGASIVFEPLASTQMACTPAAMDQERKFFDALAATRSFQLDLVQRKLALLDAEQKLTVRFSRM